MRIILTMVGIALGLAIAVVAGVYGWREYEATRPIAAPVATATRPAEGEKKPETSAPKPVGIPPATIDAKTPPASSTTAPLNPPKQITPGTLPTPSPSANKPQSVGTPAPAPAGTSPFPTPPATPNTPGEDTPIAVPEKPNVATAEKLNRLIIGMTEDDVTQTIGADGVVTPDDSLPAYTPEGWYEVRWPNADGSYIAGLFSDRGTLANLNPFNMPGADTWLATPWYAVPKWLNDKMQGNNMIVRVPAVDVVEAQASVYQFSGPLANAEGQVLGTISGTYYLNDPAGRFTRAVEGTYEYTLPNGGVDTNTFQFTE